MELAFALTALELILSTVWNRAYFSWGLPLWRVEIDFPESSSGDLPLEIIATRANRSTLFTLAFKPLSDVRCAFRERLLPLRLARISYFPVMHGAIVIDKPNRSVRVIGLCNAYAIFLPISLCMLFDGPGAWIVFAILFGASYALQRLRFGHVAAAILQITQDEAMPHS